MPLELDASPHLFLLPLPHLLSLLRVDEFLLNDLKLAFVQVKINHPPSLVDLAGPVKVRLNDAILKEMPHVGVI
eukprot:CAMPEP_0182467936 /NCGR_PEP_ID=MMETSP1319-20130603/14731_1 /TAXON_ID=172717 /ORGANISM="Bolidomonas pacifica, Strain RCC208" /LENGTH=73 /DNA_ID=CAMNT_0024668083 /DNA_START=185 /DNA_END=406 /DNA_ORIENTATION=-